MLKLVKLPFEAALRLESRLIDLCAPVSSSNSLASPLEGWIRIVMDGSRSTMISSCILFSVFLEKNDGWVAVHVTTMMGRNTLKGLSLLFRLNNFSILCYGLPVGIFYFCFPLVLYIISLFLFVKLFMKGCNDVGGASQPQVRSSSSLVSK